MTYGIVANSAVGGDVGGELASGDEAGGGGKDVMKYKIMQRVAKHVVTDGLWVPKSDPARSWSARTPARFYL